MAECHHIIRAAQQLGVAPFVSTLNRDQQPTTFYTDLLHEPEQKLLSFFKTRAGLQLKDLSELTDDYFITNVNMIGDAKLIDAVERSIADEAHLVAYSGVAFEGANSRWMDINHSSATKGGAVKLLKEQLKVEKVICFGDGENDLSLFELADESYAPENAKDNVKEAATAVIGHHDQEGIAHFLRERFGLV
jgi:hydroxymethylpyrimidine pyrophosphatase-like HAD family hydrolase